eukprot:PLAT8287.1.p1 GENE.PLAT8287.1~~PLAT8287.1.p1  ORF type:complete len:229 (-),score=65.62 PLAT8287.1:39-725(-)
MAASAPDIVEYDALFKVVLVGDAGVGKSNFLGRLTHRDAFDPTRAPTVGVEFASKVITIVDEDSGERVRLKGQVWDTAGQERFKAITKSHYRRAHGALLVYDITNHKTFENARSVWLPELLEVADESAGVLSRIMLVGNKSDLVAEASSASASFVSEEEHKSTADRMGLLQSFTSAKTGASVEAAFEQLLIEMYKVRKGLAREFMVERGIKLAESKKAVTKRRSCCAD